VQTAHNFQQVCQSYITELETLLGMAITAAGRFYGSVQALSTHGLCLRWFDIDLRHLTQQKAIGHKIVDQNTKPANIAFDWPLGAHLNLEQGNKIFVLICPKELFNQLFAFGRNITRYLNAQPP
jgi:hypothetical protein